jgi:predicted nucleotide-binding protein (sugar kinase/HSP70/actin superfamily)
MWIALVAVDTLSRKLLETRPYELHPGDAEKVAHHHIPRVADAVGSSGFLDAVTEALRAFDSVETAARGERPRIGFVGEHYIQTNSYANNDLVREIERLGGEVWPSPYFTDYLRIQARTYPTMLRRMGRLAGAVTAWVKYIVQSRDYDRLERLFEPFLVNKREPTVPEIFAYTEPFLSREMEAPVVVNVAKAVDFALKGCAGLVHAIPLGCLMSTAAASTFPRLRAHHANIPILSLTYDGLQATNQRSRLQAFMHQVGTPPATRQTPDPEGKMSLKS